MTETFYRCRPVPWVFQSRRQYHQYTQRFSLLTVLLVFSRVQTEGFANIILSEVIAVFCRHRKCPNILTDL